jgi:hypothetical protein
MLNIQLFILDQKDALRYGRRVKAFAGPIDVKGVIREELKNRRGRMLFTGTARFSKIKIVSNKRSLCQ